MSEQRGKFIVFEGIDGSGKSTVSAAIHAWMLSLDEPVHKTFEPTDGPIGSVIRNVLKHRIVADEKTIGAMFVADRLDHILNNENGMLKYLNRGTHVICDRYYYSSYAYHVPYLSLDYVIQANSVCADLLRPDLVIYLKITPEISMDRIGKNRSSSDLFETKERITQVFNNYEKAIAREGHSDNVKIIDASKPLEEVINEVKILIQDELMMLNK